MPITQRARKILWARSGNECAFADCTQELVIHGQGESNVILGEEAHIVAQKLDGPRGDTDAPDGDIDGVVNLLLVCPTHHRIIDEQPQAYGVKVLLEIKQKHEDRVAVARERRHPKSNFHPSTKYERFSALPIFKSWENEETILVVSMLGNEPISIGRHSWRGNGLVFEIIRSRELVYSGVYSEADSDVLFTVDGTMILITEQIFDFKAQTDTPFIQRLIDMGQPNMNIRSIRLYTPPEIPCRTEEEIMAIYEHWLADGIDPEIAVINLRDYGFTNPIEVRSLRNTK